MRIRLGKLTIEIRVSKEKSKKKCIFPDPGERREVFKESAKRLIHTCGSCFGINCDDCPLCEMFNEDTSCLSIVIDMFNPNRYYSEKIRRARLFLEQMGEKI